MIIGRRIRPSSCCDESVLLSENSSVSEDLSDSEKSWNNDTNNNILLKNGRKRNETSSMEKSSSSNMTKYTPSYVPSYVRSVGFDCNRSKQSSRSDSTKRKSYSGIGSDITYVRKNQAYSATSRTSSSETRREHIRLKHKYASLSTPAELGKCSEQGWKLKPKPNPENPVLKEILETETETDTYLAKIL